MRTVPIQPVWKSWFRMVWHLLLQFSHSFVIWVSHTRQTIIGCNRKSNDRISWDAEAEKAKTFYVAGFFMQNFPDKAGKSGIKLDRCKTRQCVLANMHTIGQMVSGLSGEFLDYPDTLYIVRTVSRLSGKSLDCPDSF